MTTTEARPANLFEAPSTERQIGRRRAVAAKAEPMSTLQYVVVGVCSALLVLTGWTVVYALLLSGLQEHHDQQVMYSHLRERLALATVPIGGQIAPGTPIGLLNAPAAGLHNTVLVEGSGSHDLQSGPGHVPNTPLPAQAGVSVIFGRSSTFGAPFRSLASLKPGETISITTGQGEFGFRVLDVRAAGDPLPPNITAQQSRVTFVTSAEHGWRSGWTPNQALYVDADLATGKVQPAPAGRPAYIPAADQLFASDTGRLVPLVFWLQLALLAAAGLTWAWLRWNRMQTWIIGLPIAIAVLWGTAGAAMPLLPNLI